MDHSNVQESMPSSSSGERVLGGSVTNLDLDALRKIPTALRANYLVGAFLNYFANMEFALDHALAAALGLEDIKGIVVTKGSPFAAKVSMLRTLSTIANPGDREKLAKIASKLMAANEDRKIVAHMPFGASDTNDGVLFIVMKVKDKFSFPDEDWSIDSFYKKIVAMQELEQALLQHKKELEKQPAAAEPSEVAKALAAGDSRGGLFGLLSDVSAGVSATGPEG